MSRPGDPAVMIELDEDDKADLHWLIYCAAHEILFHKPSLDDLHVVADAIADLAIQNYNESYELNKLEEKTSTTPP